MTRLERIEHALATPQAKLHHVVKVRRDDFELLVSAAALLKAVYKHTDLNALPSAALTEILRLLQEPIE